MIKMKTLSKYSCFFVIVFTSLLFSCQKESNETLLEQFVGSWINEDANYREIWIKKDETFYSNSFLIEGKDIIPQENARIVMENGVLHYKISIPGHQEEKEITFVLSKKTDKLIVFKNESNSFPQYISYEVLDNNRLKSSLSGSIQGENKIETFLFTKEN